MRVHLVNPSDTSFGVAVITPRWLYVLAQATPDTYGVPLLTDETLSAFDLESVARPDQLLGVELPFDDEYFIVVNDANDTGSAIHVYRLIVDLNTP